MSSQSMMILIVGPYRTGTKDDPQLMEKNLRCMEAAALPLYRAGHIPVIGEWLALPLMRDAGSKHPGDAIYNEILMPLTEHLLHRCDAILRVPGVSAGADEHVDLARNRGLKVFYGLEQIPGLE
ncbi:MAG TPA: DUF4406 domain-containing protein [Terracidiphilus sp.]